jgi:2-oxoglutarate dehydrogenase E2 component (dihydrolipoamide succinyltransferase)
MVAEVRMPMESPNDTEAEVVRWLAGDRTWVAAGDEVVEVESAKAVMAISTGQSGYLSHHVAEGGVVAVGALLATVHDTVEGIGTVPVPQSGRVAHETRFSADGQRELDRLSLSADLFAGAGLVTGRMVREAAARDIDRVTLGPAKRTEITRLSAGANAFASSLTIEFESAGLRTAIRDAEPPQPLVLAVIANACAVTLRQFPDLNARYYDGMIERYLRVNVGVAVDLGLGLRVPVLPDADQLDVTAATLWLLDAMAAYQSRQLAASDISGGTVTISDLSGDDIMHFRPLLTQDQSLAVGVGGDGGAPGHPMTLTAVFDHRVTTGRIVAQFLNTVRERVLGWGRP